MKKNHHNDLLCLSDSDCPILGKPQNYPKYLLPSMDSVIKSKDLILERHLNAKFQMKVASCEDFENFPSTSELDQKMKRRKTIVFIYFEF